MNQLMQIRSGLIGSAQDIEKLASAKKATLLVLSDMHCDNYSLFCEIMNQFGADSDALIYCGDGVRDVARFFTEAASDEKCAICFLRLSRSSAVMVITTNISPEL